MKYYYERPEIATRLYGQVIHLEHPVYQAGTLYLERGVGIIVVQKKFNESCRDCFWTAVDADIANDIYLAPRFRDFFSAHATATDYPIFQLRKLMWALRMKPLTKESWEEYF